MAQCAVREFLKDGLSPFAGWFNKLNAVAASKVTTALYRLEYGNFSNVEPVGEGVSEYRIDFCPGYRIYFGQDGKTLIIVLFGGDKKTQKRDIDKAKELWREYKTGKQRGG
jgi:putative addiction module killer protein